jgi:hypothetical protein
MQEKEKSFFAHEKRQRNPLSSLLVNRERPHQNFIVYAEYISVFVNREEAA